MPKLLDWEQLQEDVRIVLEEVDGRAKISKGSGAVKGNGDVQSPSYMAECKLRSTSGYTINYDTYRKICDEARLLGKIPLLITQNVKKEILVTMSLEDFSRVASSKDTNERNITSSSDLH